MISRQSGTAFVNGIEIYYEVRGQGPVVLLISGATGDAGHFARAAELLASDHTVITYDRRGNSRSPATGPTSLDQQADDAAELLRHFEVTPATVFGTSGGAIIALRLAMRAPDVVRRLIVHEPPFLGALPNAEETAGAMGAHIKQALAHGGPRGAMELFVRENAGNDTFERLEPAMRERMLQNGQWFFEHELALFMSWLPAATELASIRVPVRVLAGEDSRGGDSHRTSEWLAKGLGVDLLKIPGTHAPYLSTPRDFVASLRPLLDDAPRQMRVSVRGKGAPIVLVGGGLTGMANWESHQIELSLERKAVRAQLLSVQYGLDGRPLPIDYSVRTESDALARAIDDLGFVEPIDLVAWSYGAEVTLDFALQHPERIRTLSLIEPPAFWVLDATARTDVESQRQSDELRALYATFRGDVSEEQLAAFARQVGLCPPQATPQSLPQWPSWRKHRNSLLTGDAPWRHTDTRARLEALCVPVLLVKGAGSAHFLHCVIDALAMTFKAARVIELSGGHAPQLVCKDRFMAELKAFVANAGTK